ncbi:phosphotransferase [Nonomuraea sp. 3-1Str]|uniref:phosphotransferase enzyme family protein n=1 Tax=Nonomuraea sp. 3-1Str TaxID=2929801 RepID=UPI0028642218|nr:phosphotransferase [Nonomuraea sp. 3-1Str]MDR8409730.1 phosphotransferase [Nonomuraea sp. 3-1Str]
MIELAARAREAFGWTDDIVVSAGQRGARGQIWRLEVGHARYALKQIFAGPPSEALIEAELAFSRQAAEAGVRLPASHPDRAGRHLIDGPGGTWLRLYDWVDLRPVDLAAPSTPHELGTLLARLHRCAPSAAGEPVHPWYDHVPAAQKWEAARASGAEWAEPLGERLASFPELCAAVAPADPAGLILCHRDLHPENVLADESGALVVVDWDNLGPAAPGRELAQALIDWFGDGAADLDAMRRMYEAYVRAGGPGRVTEPADFSMLVATRLNFLLLQTRQTTEWAGREIDQALRIMPTPGQLADVLDLLTRPQHRHRAGEPREPRAAVAEKMFCTLGGEHIGEESDRREHDRQNHRPDQAEPQQGKREGMRPRYRHHEEESTGVGIQFLPGHENQEAGDEARHHGQDRNSGHTPEAG